MSFGSSNTSTGASMYPAAPPPTPTFASYGAQGMASNAIRRRLTGSSVLTAPQSPLPPNLGQVSLLGQTQ